MVGLLLATPETMKVAVFLERDGILTLPKVDRQYQIAPRTLEELVINREALGPLQELKKAGFLLIATTNQPGISRGYLSRREVDRMHDLVRGVFALDDLLMCPHDEMDRCPCRKPKSGLFREAAFKYQLSLDHSFVVSDKWQDANAAQSVGCTSLLVKSQWNGGGHVDYVLPDLESASRKAIQLHAGFFEPLLEILNG
jgi:histidinol-phosphate phosphatase family protein